MTLNVAIRCEDGILLASDTLVEYTKDFRYTSHASKIETAKQSGVAVACAGTGTAALAACLLVRHIDAGSFDPSNMAQDLERISSEAFRQEFGAIVDQLKDRGRAEQAKSLLLVATGNSIYRVEICSIPLVQTCLAGFQVAGDCANAATFFLISCWAAITEGCEAFGDSLYSDGRNAKSNLRRRS